MKRTPPWIEYRNDAVFAADSPHNNTPGIASSLEHHISPDVRHRLANGELVSRVAKFRGGLVNQFESIYAPSEFHQYVFFRVCGMEAGEKQKLIAYRDGRFIQLGYKAIHQRRWTGDGKHECSSLLDESMCGRNVDALGDFLVDCRPAPRTVSVYRLLNGTYQYASRVKVRSKFKQCTISDTGNLLAVFAVYQATMRVYELSAPYRQYFVEHITRGANCVYVSPYTGYPVLVCMNQIIVFRSRNTYYRWAIHWSPISHFMEFAAAGRDLLVLAGMAVNSVSRGWNVVVLSIFSGFSAPPENLASGILPPRATFEIFRPDGEDARPVDIDAIQMSPAQESVAVVLRIGEIENRVSVMLVLCRLRDTRCKRVVLPAIGPANVQRRGNFHLAFVDDDTLVVVNHSSCHGAVVDFSCVPFFSFK